jgi:hypothetical protein
MHVFDPTVFVISQVPSDVEWPQVVGITVTALILTVLATIYPALRGAATSRPRRCATNEVRAPDRASLPARKPR